METVETRQEVTVITHMGENSGRDDWILDVFVNKLDVI